MSKINLNKVEANEEEVVIVEENSGGAKMFQNKKANIAMAVAGVLIVAFIIFGLWAKLTV